jgi:glycosyltransferase involved in cell wall biosynthesis
MAGPSDKQLLPKISIITPSFIQGEYLEETILSVLSQDYSNLQYIVIDGGSEDDSVMIIRKYARFLSYWESEPDRGQTHAINKGLQHSSGEIIGYLNSDDCLLPGCLATVANAYLNRSTDKVIFMGSSLIGSELATALNRFTPSPLGGSVDLLGGPGLCPQPATFWTNDSRETMPYFIDRYRFGMDHEFWVHLILRLGYKATVIRKDLAFYRLHQKAKGATLTPIMWSEHAATVALAMPGLTFLERARASAYARNALLHSLLIPVWENLKEKDLKTAAAKILSIISFNPEVFMSRKYLGAWRSLLVLTVIPHAHCMQSKD